MVMFRKVLSKYQITLPRQAVKELRLRQGDLLECEVKDRQIVLSPVEVNACSTAKSLLDEVSRKWERLGIQQKDIEAAVRWARKR